MTRPRLPEEKAGQQPGFFHAQQRRLVQKPPPPQPHHHSPRNQSNDSAHHEVLDQDTDHRRQQTHLHSSQQHQNPSHISTMSSLLVPASHLHSSNATDWSHAAPNHLPMRRSSELRSKSSHLLHSSAGRWGRRSSRPPQRSSGRTARTPQRARNRPADNDHVTPPGTRSTAWPSTGTRSGRLPQSGLPPHP